MSLQSTVTASVSPLSASSAASQVIWTWAKRVSGCWAPSQMSLMYRDTRNAAVAEEGEKSRAVRTQIHWAEKQVVPHHKHGRHGASIRAQMHCGNPR